MVNNLSKQLNFFLGIFLTFCMASESYAIGGSFIGNEVPSARAAGQGYVGVAGQNNDPTAVYTNPAAITSLKGTQVTGGATWENIHGSYKDNAGTESKERVTNVGVPNMSVTQSFLDGKLAAGLGVQSPFGLETYWGANSPLRYVATDSRLDMVDVTPVIAYQVHPMVSVGAGVDYVNMFNAELNKQINVTAVNSALGAPSAGADATASLRGQAANWGYHAGIMIQPNEQHSIGIAYHSKVDLRVNGNISVAGLSGADAISSVFGGSSYNTSAYTDLVLPQNVQFGYAFKPNEKWTFEADTAWYHWSEDQDINVRYPAATANQQAVLTTTNPNTGQVLGNPVSLAARDAWSASTGVNYKVNDRWQVRSGFWYEPWALPESTFSPSFMDLTRYGLSIGAGYVITENLSIDAAYSAVFMHSRTINNDVAQNATGIPSSLYNVNGTYSDFANLLALNFTYRFGRK